MSPDAPPVVDLVAAISANRVAVQPGEAGAMLPTVSGADGFPDLSDLFAAAGVVAGLIIAPSMRLASEPPLQVHTLAVAELPAGGSLGLDELERLGHPPAVAAAIRQSLAEHRGAVPHPPGRPDWFRAGWLDTADRWIDGVLSERGVVRAAPSVPVKWWSLSAVLRVPVQSRDGATSLFFKAACDWFRAEPALTRGIDRRFPGVVPDLLAVDVDRGWMLMRPFDPGVGGHDAETAVAAAETMARLQRELVDQTDDFLLLGCPDRRLDPTLAGLHRLLHDSVEVELLDEDERSAARAMEPWLVQRVVGLAEAGLPYSVGHGDLHLGNVARSSGRVILYDWTDAAVTFPVLDAVMLARSAGDPHAQAVREAYAAVWREGYAATQVTAALDRAGLVNRIYQAISYEGIYRAQERRTRSEMGGLVAMIIRELVTAWRSARAGG